MSLGFFGNAPADCSMTIGPPDLAMFNAVIDSSPRRAVEPYQVCTEPSQVPAQLTSLLPYRTLAYNNAWANHRLLRACAALSPEDLIAPRTSFFPTLRATLNHILIVDWFYVDAMEGGTLGPAAWADREPCRTVVALQQAQTEVDRRLLAIVEELDETGLGRIVAVHRDTRTQHERIDRVLLHLFQHQIHHRGQAHAILSATSTPPPQLDEFFSSAEAPLRAEEFRLLGWTEERIWGDTRGKN